MELKQVKTKDDLEEAVVKTIAFFDLFDCPVTLNEIWRYSGARRRLSEVIKFLEMEGLKDIFESKSGFYFLAGREELIKTRLARYNYTDRKFKRAIWVARVFKLVPWIKMMAVGNIIGAHNLKNEGDIDLFIITAKNRIWLARFFCVGIIKLLNLRPKPGQEKDKICLSFFVSEDNLDLRDLRLGQKGTKFPACASPLASARRAGNLVPQGDIYFNYWLAGLVPIFNINNTYEKFIKANSWLRDFFPNWRESGASHRRDVGRPLPKLYYYILDFVFGWAEGLMQKFQIKILPDNLKNLINKDTRTVVNDRVIKLYSNDRREEYREKFYAKIKKLN
ncbi:hypothetical protein COV49_02530 [Candidatus Falkowbacteria bacterium CG11_big_fil_rev_8_21_14_0_20_39_10]|uniref:Polymerase nucleotidyl transferase domain-containing protein n=1 Tax=Candidatus Falkowbacteria bacterium CG11_big_fil_rev_8_21_14_0_20_39_10 TaxID=1974570 RepID=A0A2M6K972_9BACT|nr:MAG: hypothetical protein COV49_02530 [Candidatus Falkowbacteria bacterium CG11_big_fil_rev_8_21_14_0_20_39_10]